MLGHLSLLHRGRGLLLLGINGRRNRPRRLLGCGHWVTSVSYRASRSR